MRYSSPFKKKDLGVKPPRTKSGIRRADFKIVQPSEISDDDLKESFSMRFQEYCVEMRSLDPADFPDAMESDEYDSTAAHFILRTLGVTTGTIRVTFEREGKFLLETGKDGFTLPKWIVRKEACEPSRLVGRSIRDPRYGIFRQSTELLKAACLWSLESGFSLWIVAWQERFFKALKEEGWPFHVFGMCRDYHNTSVVYVFLDLEELRDTMFKEV